MAKGAMAMPSGMDDYQAQDDARTLAQAYKIRKHPARHKAAKAHAKMMMAATHGAAEKAAPMMDKKGKAEGMKNGGKVKC